MRHQHLIWIAMVAVVVGFALNAQAHPQRGCSSCHVPHNGVGDGSAESNGQVPLWNPLHSVTVLTDYYTGSATIDATMAAPTGGSKLCLSCHDGTYPNVSSAHRFGQINQKIVGGVPVVNGMGNLTNNHPISFTYDADLLTKDPNLVDPSTLPKDVLSKDGKMHCYSCHQVHAHTDRQETANLRWAYTPDTDATTTAAFCRHCHKK